MATPIQKQNQKVLINTTSLGNPSAARSQITRLLSLPCFLPLPSNLFTLWMYAHERLCRHDPEGIPLLYTQRSSRRYLPPPSLPATVPSLPKVYSLVSLEVWLISNSYRRGLGDPRGLTAIV